MDGRHAHLVATVLYSILFTGVDGYFFYIYFARTDVTKVYMLSFCGGWIYKTNVNDGSI